MTSKPMKRYTKSTTKRNREVASAESLSKLYDIDRFVRNELTLSQINRLREIIDLQGFQRAAELVGVCDVTLLRVTSGFGHKLRPQTAAKVREFFGK